MRREGVRTKWKSSTRGYQRGAIQVQNAGPERKGLVMGSNAVAAGESAMHEATSLRDSV